MKTGHEEIDSLFCDDFVIDKVEECNEDGLRICIDASVADQHFEFEFLHKDGGFVVVEYDDLGYYLDCAESSLYKIAFYQLMCRFHHAARGAK